MGNNKGNALYHNSAKRKNSRRIQKNWNVPKEQILYIPENLDIDKILSDKPPTFKYERDCFVYLLH
ncbi:MAG: hypothetical protein ACK43K_12870, partial [Chitinophagales bacterium]